MKFTSPQYFDRTVANGDVLDGHGYVTAARRVRELKDNLAFLLGHLDVAVL